MSERITWRSVSAPNFDDAIDARRLGASLFDKAATGISDTLSAIEKRKREQQSQEAMSKAMQIRDVDAWDRMMQNGGLASLGINPAKATDDLMTFMQKRRGTLADNLSDDLNFKQDTLDYQQDIYQGERDKITAERADVAHSREEEEYERKKQKRLMEEAAPAELRTMLGDHATRAELERHIVNTVKDPKKQATLLAATKDMPEQYFSVDERLMDGDSLNEQATTYAEEISEEVDTMTRDYQRTTNQLLFDELQTAVDDPNVNYGLQLVEELRGMVDPGKNADSEEVENVKNLFDESAIEITDLVSKLATNNPGVPKSAIAMLIKQELASGGNLWERLTSGGKLQLNEKMITDRLQALTDPNSKEYKLLANKRVEYEDKVEKHKEVLGDIEAAKLRYGVLKSNGRSTESAERDMRKSVNAYLKLQGKAPVSERSWDKAMETGDFSKFGEAAARLIQAPPQSQPQPERERDTSIAARLVPENPNPPLETMRPEARPYEMHPGILAGRRMLAAAGEAVDDAAAQAGANTVWGAEKFIAQPMRQILGFGTGLFNAEWGSKILENADERLKNVEEIRERGSVFAPAEQDPAFGPRRPTPTEGLQENDPMRDLPLRRQVESMVLQNGVDRVEGARLIRMAELLQTGRDENNQPLHPGVKALYENELRNFMEQMRSR